VKRSTGGQDSLRPGGKEKKKKEYILKERSYEENLRHQESREGRKNSETTRGFKEKPGVLRKRGKEWEDRCVNDKGKISGPVSFLEPLVSNQRGIAIENKKKEENDRVMRRGTRGSSIG